MAVHGFQERRAALDRSLRDSLGKAEIGNPEIRLARIRNAHRVIVAAKERGAEIIFVLTSTVPLRNEYVRRNGVARAELFGDDRAQARELHSGIDLMPRDGVVRGLRMIVAAGVHRPHQRQLVHRLGDLRQQLGDLNAGDVG